MNNQYLVIHTVRTNISLECQLPFQIEDIKIYIEEDTAYSDKNCSGWLSKFIVKIVLSDTSIEKAVRRSFELVDGFVGLISFQTGVAIEIPVLDRAIDITDGTKDRIFLQNIILPITLGTKRALVLGDFQLFFKHLDQKAVSQNSKSLERIALAIRWYRKGISETDAIARFSQLWIGLEVLNPILSKKYHSNIIKNSQYFLPEKPTELIQLNGVKFFLLERMKQSHDFWKECIEIRKGIVHGINSIDEIKTRAMKSSPVIEESLQKGVLDCLDISEDEIEKISHISYSSCGDTQNRVYVTLINAKNVSINIEELPFLEVIWDDKEHHKIQNCDEHTFSIEYKIKNFDGKCIFQDNQLIGKIDPEKTKQHFSSTVKIKKNRILKIVSRIKKILKF